jgi:hypothetical protein
LVFFQLIVFILIGLAIGLLLGLIFEYTIPNSWYRYELGALLVDWTVTLLSVLSAVFMLDYAQSRYGWSGLGFGRDNLGESLRLGLLVGGGIILLCFWILYLGGWVSIIGTTWVANLFGGWLLFFLIQPLAEEIIMRSFLQNQLHRYFGAWPGLLVSAVVFGLLHAGNNNFTWLAGIQIFLGGLLMGQLFLYYQNIWAPFAMHAIWNFLQSTVLGFSVSGMETYTLLQLHISGPEWLTGGNFGIEGSLLSVVMIVVANIYFWPVSRNEAPWSKEELKAIDSTEINLP